MEKINAPLPKEKIFSIHNVKNARNQTMIKTKISLEKKQEEETGEQDPGFLNSCCYYKIKHNHFR